MNYNVVVGSRFESCPAYFQINICMNRIIKNNWDLKSVVAVSLIPGLHNENCIKLINITADIKSFFASPALLGVSETFSNISLFASPARNFLADAEQAIAICDEKGFSIVTFWDDDYPELLKQISNPPILLYVWGNLHPQNSVIIAVVGTRRCTEYGRLACEHFTKGFVDAGVIIASGLATGIDTYSHFAAMNNGGITYAIVASGLDKISPSSSLENAKKIIQSGGAIISTYPPGISAIPPFFLQRNRIISGLSKAVLVVESAFKGGSLNTAHNAFSQNREVYAVPGKFNAEKSFGTNNLIRKNIASIAVSPNEILKDLGVISETNIFTKTVKDFDLTPNQQLIFNNIDSDPIGIDTLVEKTGLDIATVSTELLTLEFMNAIVKQPGNNYIRILV